MTPARLLDTRPGFETIDGVDAGIGLRPAGSITTLVVAGRAGIPAGATTVALNVTATDAALPGYVTVFPCGQQRPLASIFNYMPGAAVANAVIATIGQGGAVCLFTLVNAHLVVDVSGYLSLPLDG